MRETVNFVSWESQWFPRLLRFEWNKINCFPRDQCFSDLLYSWKFWNWKFIKPRCNGIHWSTFAGNSALLPADITDFAMLPAQKFWLETVSLLGVMWPWSNQWERVLLGKNFQLCNNKIYLKHITQSNVHWQNILFLLGSEEFYQEYL